MAYDGGLIANIENWFVLQLAALTNGGKKVFTKADVWRSQIAATKAGFEAFSRYTPFAFVKYQPAKPDREGDYDLRQVIRIAIAIGVESKVAGDARIGNSNKLGISKIRDLVIGLFDSVHPGGGLECDDFYYVGEAEAFESPKRYAIEMYFEANYVTD